MVPVATTSPRIAAILAAAAVLLAIAPGQAQEAGCTEADPCPWPLDVDEDGFVDDPDVDEAPTRTAGDWFFLDVQNLDSREHVIRLEGAPAEVRFTVPALGDSSGGAAGNSFTFRGQGTYRIVDETTGDELHGCFTELDAVAYEEIAGQCEAAGRSSGSNSKGSPGPAAMPALLLALGAVLVLRRRAD